MMKKKNLRNTRNIKLKDKGLFLMGWIAFCFLTVILVFNISETAYSQDRQGLDTSQEEEIKRQLRLSGMSESEIQRKIDMLKVSNYRNDQTFF